MITNLAEATATRGLFPCWDDPLVKTPFEIAFYLPFNYTVFSNELLHNRTYNKDDNNKKLIHFHTISTLPVCLLAFTLVDVTLINVKLINLSSLFQTKKSKPNDVFWYREEVRIVIRAANSAMNYLSGFFWKYIKPIEIPLKINYLVLPHIPMKFMARPGIVIFRYATYIIKMLSYKLLMLERIINIQKFDGMQMKQDYV